jgi:UDP:flavonoid glycosyltransferase YjiC (YdhE family)
LLISPFIGDMSETAMRVSWTKAGLSLPWRLCRPTPLRWAARRILGDPSFTAHAGELAAWAEDHDGAKRGAELVEQLAQKHAPA